MNKHKPSRKLLNARRDLDDLPGVEVLEDLEWYEYDREEVWVLHCRLTPGHTAQRYLATSTEWYVTMSPDYPWGEIRFYPAKQKSIDRTFYHQLHNSTAQDTRPWRLGDICRYSPAHRLGIHGADPEPLDEWHRLSWHFKRALRWLEDAANDTLVLPGEPFEMPHYPISVGGTLVYLESVDTMRALPADRPRSGYATLFTSKGIEEYTFVKNLRSLSGCEMSAPSWGRYISMTLNQEMTAIWVILDGPPVLPPWHAPATWAELCEAVSLQGLNLPSLINSVSDYIRDGQQHLALIGFPVPERFYRDPTHLYWKAVLLPTLAVPRNRPRQGPVRVRWLRRIDWEKRLKATRTVQWMNSENWSPDQISRRRGRA